MTNGEWNTSQHRDTQERRNARHGVPEGDRWPRAAHVTPEGAAWLASSSEFPRSVKALWSARPTAPSVLPCGTAFDVVTLPSLFGRRVLEQMWAGGPGSGPVALHHDRLLVFAATGTAQRLPSLLGWEEWGRRVPPLMCHGRGDAVTVPAVFDGPDGPEPSASSRWVVAPDTARPWLPGPGVLLWACIRSARAAATA